MNNFKMNAVRTVRSKLDSNKACFNNKNNNLSCLESRKSASSKESIIKQINKTSDKLQKLKKKRDNLMQKFNKSNIEKEDNRKHTRNEIYERINYCLTNSPSYFHGEHSYQLSNGSNNMVTKSSIAKAIDFSSFKKTPSRCPAQTKSYSGRSSSEMRETEKLDHPYEKLRFHESSEIQLNKCVDNRSPFKLIYSHRMAEINQNQLSSPQNRQKSVTKDNQIQKRNLIDSFQAFQGSSFEGSINKQFLS